MTDDMSGKFWENKPIMLGSALCCCFFGGSVDFSMKGKFSLTQVCQLSGGKVCLILRTSVRNPILTN